QTEIVGDRILHAAAEHTAEDRVAGRGRSRVVADVGIEAGVTSRDTGRRKHHQAVERDTEACPHAQQCVERVLDAIGLWEAATAVGTAERDDAEVLLEAVHELARLPVVAESDRAVLAERGKLEVSRVVEAI